MDNIKKDIDELFKEIDNSEVYKNYLSSKKQLECNKEITDLVNNIKRLQKIATNNKDEQVELELKDLYNKLNSYPLYQSYLTYKEELNNMLTEVSDTFSNYFNDMLKI